MVHQVHLVLQAGLASKALLDGRANQARVESQELMGIMGRMGSPAEWARKASLVRKVNVARP
jgi:hypothetical protein